MKGQVLLVALCGCTGVSVLGYLSPVAFERQLEENQRSTGVTGDERDTTTPR